MKKLKISLLLTLRAELTELLTTVKDVLLKMYLLKMLQTVNNYLSPFDETQKQFLLENGTQNEDGNFTLKSVLEDGTPNPKFQEYLKLLEEELDVELKPIPIKLFENAGSSDKVFIELTNFIEF